jgi:hypothetical protein
MKPSESFEQKSDAEMIIVMFLHFVSDLASLCRRSTKDLLAKDTTAS